MNRIRINGVDIVGGRNVSIINGVVTVDGVVQGGELAKVAGVVEVRVVEGVIENLETDAAVACGEVTGSIRAGGAVSCDAVGGNVQAGGSVSCDDVGGHVQAGGSVNCKGVAGSVVSAGAVRRG